jgi:hypothetical protein
MKSPMNGINLIQFMAADFLLPVNAYNIPVMMALGISPMGGIPRIGPPTKSKTSAISDNDKTMSVRNLKSDFSISDTFITVRMQYHTHIYATRDML